MHRHWDWRGLVSVGLAVGLAVGVSSLGCMSAPERQRMMGLDGGDEGVLDRGVDGGPVRPPLGHLPEGSACGGADGNGYGASANEQRATAANHDDGGSEDGTQSDAIAAADGGMHLPAPAHAGDLVITEFMADPETLDDAAGEWFELYNPGQRALELQGCGIEDRSVKPHAIAQHVVIEPGAYLTIARASAPGFAAGATAPFSLTNSAGQIGVVCNGVVIDRVVFDRSLGFPLSPGASASLDPMHDNAQDNDAPSAWCLATESYGPELGTPGAVNPPCFAADASVP